MDAKLETNAECVWLDCGCKKGCCKLWAVEKSVVSCEKTKRHLAGIAAGCEKCCCLLRNVCNAPKFLSS
jgi:hypothetical protein